MNSFQIKVLAVVSMIVDHVGFVFFPQVTIFRVFGRLAFPLFAFLAGVGFTKTSNKRNYFFRLASFAVISQIPYIWMIRAGGGEGLQLNIFFTLSFGLLVLSLIERYKNKVSAVLIIILFFVLFDSIFRFEYGAYGLLLMLSNYLFLNSKIKGIFSILSISFLNILYRIVYLGTHLQIYALSVIPIMYMYNGEKGNDKYKNWFYYIYPVHMLVIALLAYLIK